MYRKYKDLQHVNLIIDAMCLNLKVAPEGGRDTIG